MGPNIFEGTWEEVVSHAAELAGRRVRLTVLDDQPAPVMLDRALAPLLEAAAQLARERSAEHSGDSSADAWAEGILAKFRAQGFRL
jgi:hypothetical protein